MRWYIEWLLIIILVSIILRTAKKKFTEKNTSIFKNGFQVLDCFTESDVNYLITLWNAKETEKMKEFIHNNQNVLTQVQEILGSDYIFQDYILLIEKSRIHTCHRDFNAKSLNNKQKYPSYTIIFYLENMDRCLDVIDKSHKTRIGMYLTDETKSIPCKKGDAVLFDAGLIHSGSKNNKPDNKRIQMKITHKDDIEAVSFYQNYNKKVDKDNKNSDLYTSIQKHVTCQFPTLSDSFTNKVPKSFEKLFSSVFYGDSNFYELTNM